MYLKHFQPFFSLFFQLFLISEFIGSFEIGCGS